MDMAAEKIDEAVLALLYLTRLGAHWIVCIGRG
jgi:hypothetical protein